MPRSSAYLPGLLAIAVAALACGGDSLSPPTAGTLEVATSTAGVEPDQDGYSVQLDAEPAQSIGPAATVQTTDITPGNHTVQLAGIAVNCALAGENPRTISISAGETTTVSFTLSCSATTGSLQVSSSSGGPSPDTDGYTIAVDGTERGTLGTSGGVKVDALPPGDHLVGLSGVAGNCGVQGDNPRTVTVTAGQSADVTFTVTCSAPPTNTGTLRIATATTGPEADGNGYAFAVDGGATQPIGLNATASLTVSVGAHRVRLSGVAGNCAVQGTNPRSATVSSGATADVSFAITCTASTGSLEVSTTTTGASPDANGYTMTVDGGGPQPIGINNTLTIPKLAPGSHQVSLAGLAANCTVDGENPRTVTISLAQTASLRFSLSCPAVASAYRAIDLLSAGSVAGGINAAGQVVGSLGSDNGCNRAFLWEKGVVTELGTLGGCESSAIAINSVGQVVGQSHTAAGERHAFLWENGVMTDLGTLGGDESGAWGINDAAQVVGTTFVVSPGGGRPHGFLWEKGVMTDLGTLGGSTEASAINTGGQVVGASAVGGEAGHAFLWEKGVMTDLGTLGGEPSSASDINDAGQVVGASKTAERPVGPQQHAFLWKGGLWTDLGTLGGGTSGASAINASGQVVGQNNTAAGERHAFLWEKGVMTELGTLGGTNAAAWDINDAGQIVGWSETAAGEGHATLWTRD